MNYEDKRTKSREYKGRIMMDEIKSHQPIADSQFPLRARCRSIINAEDKALGVWLSEA